MGIAAVLISSALLSVGCSASAQASSNVTEVRATVTNFLVAEVTNNGNLACSLLIPADRQFFAAFGSSSHTCAAGFVATTSGPQPQVTPKDAEAGGAQAQVKIQGDSATAKGVAGGKKFTAHLARVHGKWLISIKL